MLKMSVSNLQVSIVGRVLEKETDKTISGAMVEIINMPEKLKTILSLKELQHGSRWKFMEERPDRKITASDGYFYFVDLPIGEYTLKASLPNSGTRYKAGTTTIQISNSINGITLPTITNIVLLPTGIKGKIVDADQQKAIVNARVQIKGSRESTFSDKLGNYSLLGLESSKSGQRNVTIIVTAVGYQEVSQSLVINHGEVTSNPNISLQQLVNN